MTRPPASPARPVGAASRTWRDVVAAHPALSAIGGTPLIPVRALRRERPDVEVLAKLESVNPGGSVKDRPVLRMLTEAIADGRLSGARAVLDSSSGNAGIAYAMIGAVLGVPVELVVPGNASLERRRRILAHGATLSTTDPLLGYDEALREVRRRAEAEPERWFFCDQYSNPHNVLAHRETTAEEILRQTDGRLTHFVAGVGTGGTITGVGRRLKEHDPAIRVIGVAPEEFPGIEGLKPLGEGHILPAILDESVIDASVPVTAEESYAMCARLAREGIFVGQSSGAYLAGVLAATEGLSSARVVTIFPDLGERYFSTGLFGDA